jgi:hypothetical protein
MGARGTTQLTYILCATGCVRQSAPTTDSDAQAAHNWRVHPVLCPVLDGKALPIGRYARLEEALASAASHMEHEKY